MLRLLTPLLAFAALVAVSVQELLAVRAPWGAPFAILVAGGGCVIVAVTLRNAPRTPLRRARGALPRDPGIPRPPLGAPYRGPH